jgi:hypothetical protein
MGGFPIGSTLRYIDGFSHHTAVVLDMRYLPSVEEWVYDVQWSDHSGPSTQTHAFMHRNMEVAPDE